ncbi:hypothetical protein AfiDRAFT_0840 [Afipia sp. 1NLS2]|jgi:hypothetical protein|nr:hypothetical protein AfiDRAFT_0840 [Afipia sp. 1NLS2]
MLAATQLLGHLSTKSRSAQVADSKSIRSHEDPRAQAIPPFSCICTLRCYYDRNLLNEPDLSLF